VNKRAILDLPSYELLRLKPVGHWIERFKSFTRRNPTEVALPGVGFAGPLYDSSVHPYPEKLESSNLLPVWVHDAREGLGEGAVVWASILVECGFLDNQSLWLRTQYGQELEQVCLVNPVVQAILKHFVTEIIESAGVDGIVLDVTDAYPNSGAKGMTGINGTCFCEFCKEALKLKGFDEPVEAFIGDQGLLRFVLRVGDEGAAHIDPTQEWIDQRDARALIAVAKSRGFVSGDTLDAEATRLLRYFAARVQMTADCIRSVFTACRDAGKRSAVILGSADADLSQLVTLQALDRAKAADEYWLPDAPQRARNSTGAQAVQFLAGRSTYMFNAFFEGVEKGDERVLLMGPQEFLARLLNTSKTLMANQLSPGSVFTVGLLDQYAGFAGVPFHKEDHLEVVTRLFREVTGQVLPDSILKSFQIANPDRRA